MPLNLKKLRSLIGADRGAIARTAESAGMAPANLSRILSGKKPDVPLSTLDRLAKALKCTPQELIR